jgi:acetyl-CoA acetyltransferase
MSLSIDKGFDPEIIESIYTGNFSSELFEGQGHITPIMADAVGSILSPAIRVEDACASSGVTLRMGVLVVASGMVDVVLVGGIEKMTKSPTSEITDTLSSTGVILYEIPAGFTFPGFYAAMATAYMDYYGMTVEDLMHVAIKNHANGAFNENAQFGISISEWMQK